MTSDEEEVEAVVRRCIQGIDQMLRTGSTEAIEGLWLHEDFVTYGHPGGDWARGWDEVKTFWGVLASVGGPGRGGIEVCKVHVRVCGDMAYAVSVTKTPASFGGEFLAITDVLERHGGEWKLVHHHTNRSRKVALAMEQMVGQ